MRLNGDPRWRHDEECSLDGPCPIHRPCVACGAPVEEREFPPYSNHEPDCPLVAEWDQRSNEEADHARGEMAPSSQAEGEIMVVSTPIDILGDGRLNEEGQGGVIPPVAMRSTDTTEELLWKASYLGLFRREERE